jgi:glucuronoarabinoxylan endo-1,4-beta-xylanase
MQQNAGVSLYALSAQNEPDWTATYASCIFSSSQMVAWVKVLGPKVHALGGSVKLLSPENSIWSHLWADGDRYGTAILADSSASAAVDILATHQYANGAVTAPPGGVTKHIWETEASGVMGSTEAGPSSTIANGVAVARWIHNAITTGGVSAWHYWWLVSLNNDNEGLLLQGGGTTKRLYTMGNYSKFIRPGYVRIGTSGSVPAGVFLTAYRNPSDGSVVLVAINSNGGASSLSVYLNGSCPTQAIPWVTSSSDDLAVKGAIAVSGGHLTATLAGTSVTTFVVK